MLEDIEGLDSEPLAFSKIPAKVNVRNGPSKSRLWYFTSLALEGCKFLEDYLDAREATGEVMSRESSLLGPDPSNMQTHNGFSGCSSRELK